MTSLTKTKDNAYYASYNKRMKNIKLLKRLGMQLLMTLLALTVLYPFFMMVGVSLKSPLEALISPDTFPSEFHFANYSEAWKIMDYPTVFLNTLIITLGGSLGIVAVTGLSAFIIAWSKHHKFYNAIYILFLCGLMIPFYTSLVPLVKLMSNLGFTNSRIGLILYYWGRNVPMATFLYVGFMRGISREILEAGEIDGTNTWTLYWKILFPLTKPITTTIFILDAMALWNDFLFPRMMLTKSALRTISLSQYYFTGELGSEYNLAFAAYNLTIIPIMLLYFVMQKHIIKGVASGAVKG